MQSEDHSAITCFDTFIICSLALVGTFVFVCASLFSPDHILQPFAGFRSLSTNFTAHLSIPSVETSFVTSTDLLSTINPDTNLSIQVQIPSHCQDPPPNFQQEFKRHCTNTHPNKLSNEEGNQFIIERIKEGCPFVIGRLSMGSEVSFVSQLLEGKRQMADMGAANAGFYPRTPEALLENAEIYFRSVESLQAPYDAAAVFSAYGDDNKWYCLNPKLSQIGSRSLEPFYFLDDPWSKYLDQKTVLVIGHFIESIQCQLRVRDKLFPGKYVLPAGTKFKFVRTFQTSMNAKYPHGSYKETLHATFDLIDAQEPYDVALISAGGYGMPFAQHIRSRGHSAIYVGGGMQIMFGIKGGRWLNHGVINKLFNKHWIFPLAVDTPSWHNTLENSAYWAKDPKDILSECPWSS